MRNSDPEISRISWKFGFWNNPVGSLFFHILQIFGSSDLIFGSSDLIGRLSRHNSWWDFIIFIFYKKQLNLLQAYSILDYRLCARSRVYGMCILSSPIGSECTSRLPSSWRAHAPFIGHRVYLINDVSKAFSYVYCVTTSFWSPSRLLSAYWSRFGNSYYNPG